MLDPLVKYFWVLLLAYAGMLGMDRYELKNTELESQQNLNDSVPPKIVKAERDLKNVQQFSANLETSKARVKEISKRIEDIQKQLPSEIGDAEVENVLATLATDLKMLKPNALHKGETNQGLYFSKEFSLDVKGTFLQGLIYFEKLDKMAKSGERILNVKYLRFSESEVGDKRSRFVVLDMTTTLEAYRYNASFKPGEN